MVYKEERSAAEGYKKTYLDGLENLILRRQKEAAEARRAYIQDIFTEPEKYRKDFIDMLGWPLTQQPDGTVPKAEYRKVTTEDGYDVFSVELEVLEGLKLHGLLFRCHGEEKRPMVILQHGGNGTPEYLAGFYEWTGYYGDMLKNVMAQKVHAFAPQLLLWDHKVYGVEYDRSKVDARLKRVGSSIAAVEIYALTKVLDYFETKDWVGKFGMIGLSYGGFYTLYTAAVDQRIQSAISCSYFNKRDAYPWANWVWKDMACRFDDPEIACMIYPRRLCIEVGKEDEVFDYRGGVESFERLKQLCGTVGTEWVDLIVYDGNHAFCGEVWPIERLAKDLR